MLTFHFSATLHPDNGWCVMNVCPTIPKTQWWIIQKETLLFCLKSVDSNFTLAVHSQKFVWTKTHFLSHVGEKKKKYG